MNADDDVMAIRKLIDDWSAAVRRRDYDGALENRSADILMFDVPPPFQSEGIDAYRKTWDVFFRWMADPPVFNFSDLRVTAGTDVAFATAHGKCAGKEEDGTRSELDFRLTVGLRKSGGKWVIVHEHHSLPATS